VDKEISVVIPVCDEGTSLPELYTRLKSVMNSLGKTYEVIFVDDGSQDNSFAIIEEFYNKEKTVKGIRFKKNFGKAAALSAGFKYARGKVIITMDADLQDDPGEIPNFLHKLDEGYDLVTGWRFKRADPISKTLPSRLFNRLTSLLTGAGIHDFNCGFKAYRKETVEDIDIYGELHRYIPVLARWRGYKIGEIKVRHHPRRHGKSKYGAERLLRGLTDLFTVIFLIRYVERPFHLFGVIGLLVFSAGFVINIYLAMLWIILKQGIGSRPLLILGMLLMVIGFQIISTGLIGEIIVSTRSKDNQGYTIDKVLE